jgi:DNA-binding CsgD family transcriptional regulator
MVKSWGHAAVKIASVDRDLVDLIGRIYDCVIDPSLWYDTLDRIRLRFGFHNASLGISELPSGNSLLQVAVNIPSPMIEVIERYGEGVVELWGGPERMMRVAIEEPVLQSHASDPARWADNAYFRAFAIPQGLVDNVGMVLARDSATLASFGMAVHGDARPPDEAVFDDLRVLAPHLRRAVTISRILKVNSAAAQSFAAALDASAAGVVLVDGNLRIVHANAAAQAMLAAGDPVRDGAGRLELLGDLAPGALAAAVAGAERSDTALGRKGIGIPARRRDGSPLTLHVMPLAGRHGGPRELSAAAAIFIGDAANGVPLPSGVLSILFDLTPAEARVFELVVDGHSTAEITDQLTIAPSTLKTHLSRVYAKTGRTDRVGLVRLAREISVPG